MCFFFDMHVRKKNACWHVFFACWHVIFIDMHVDFFDMHVEISNACWHAFVCMLTCIFLYVDMSFLLTWMLKFWVHVDMHSQQRRQPLGSHYLTYFYCTNRERKFRYSCSLHTVQNASGGAQGFLPFAIHTQAWSSPRVEGLSGVLTFQCVLTCVVE